MYSYAYTNTHTPRKMGRVVFATFGQAHLHHMTLSYIDDSFLITYTYFYVYICIHTHTHKERYIDRVVFATFTQAHLRHVALSCMELFF